MFSIYFHVGPPNPARMFGHTNCLQLGLKCACVFASRSKTQLSHTWSARLFLASTLRSSSSFATLLNQLSVNQFSCVLQNPMLTRIGGLSEAVHLHCLAVELSSGSIFFLKISLIFSTSVLQ